MAILTQNPFPLEYSPKIKVVPSDPDRLPYVPVQILYLIAQALPQPSHVFNLARVNKESWDYLQPALYECEVTYEARLVARFGLGGPHDWDKNSILRRSYIYGIGVNESEGHGGDAENDDQFKAKCGRQCAHGLVMSLCEVCGQRIAVEEKFFRNRFILPSTDIWNGRSSPPQDFFESRGMTALHWACRQGETALPVARKAIEAAKAHQPSYIDGQGLRMRRVGNPHYGGRPPFGEIPPPLFTAAAFGNKKLCEALAEAGCKVNLLQATGFQGLLCDNSANPYFRIHRTCIPDPKNHQFWHCGDEYSTSPKCQTAGHVALDFGAIDALGLLLDRGLDPLMGREPLIHRAARASDLPAVKTLLDRFPEMANHRWEDMTPLHALCTPRRYNKKDIHSLEELKSVAAYLVQKGARLEAEGNTSGLHITPLQYALMKSTELNSDKSYAAEALVMLGAVWNRSLNWYGATILNHCVYEAAFGRCSRFIPASGERGREYLTTEQSLLYARLVKAMTRSTNTPSAQGGEPPEQVFLSAFRKLPIYGKTVTKDDLNTFAIEAVGRLLLSTGINPDQGDMEKWRLVIAEGQREADWAASPWRELISDLPENVGGE